MSADVTAALQGAAQTIYAAARSHKTAEGQHRKQARSLMRQLDELRRECEARGITLEIVHDTDPQEGHSHAGSDPHP